MLRHYIFIFLLATQFLEAQEEKKEPLKEEAISTHHTTTINDIEIGYTATVGTQTLNDQKTNASKASFFYIAYTKDRVDNLKNRPITFCFNGGPGSSSVWLHLGAFGPRRVKIDDDGKEVVRPYQLQDNPHSLLDVTDLVFIDPISTGYSRTVQGEDPKQYHGLESDIQSIAEFIRLYVTRNLRWESPKFLAGESYGTTRAVGLAEELHERFHLFLDGMVLISSCLNFQTFKFSPGNDLPYILYLPTYTAAALNHQQLSDELQKNPKKTIEEAEKFAQEEYALALMKGDRLEPGARQEVVEKIMKLTSLPSSYIEEANLRIPTMRFSKQLLKQQTRIIGRFDSRIKGIDTDPCGDYLSCDPSLDHVIGPFTSTLNHYVRTELGWKRDEEYVVLADIWPWNFGVSNQYLDVTEKLKNVMSKNSRLEVFVAGSYDDMATPYFAARYAIDHLGLDQELRDNITLKTYDGGHMMYLFYPTLVKLKSDLANFIEGNTTKDFK